MPYVVETRRGKRLFKYRKNALAYAKHKRELGVPISGPKYVQRARIAKQAQTWRL